MTENQIKIEFKRINQKLNLIINLLERKEPFTGMTPEQTQEAFGTLLGLDDDN